MENAEKTVILCVDDDQDILLLLERFLTSSHYRVVTADRAAKALAELEKLKPELILLDVLMPEMDGYTFCSQLQKNKQTATIPVIFLTSLDGNESKAKAFALGAVGYLQKPIQKDLLLTTIEQAVKNRMSWKFLDKPTSRKEFESYIPLFDRFKNFLTRQIDLTESRTEVLQSLAQKDIYSKLVELGLSRREMVKLISDFTGYELLRFVDPESIETGVLPVQFCKANLVIPFNDSSGRMSVVLSNPFNADLLETIKRLFRQPQALHFLITDPDNILALLNQDSQFVSSKVSVSPDQWSQRGGPSGPISRSAVEELPVVYATNNILESAVLERASDIHFEPKKDHTSIRFRVDGDMKEVLTLKSETSRMVVSRLKILGELDIAERRKPQDGSFEARINNVNYKLRLATTSTPFGESLIIRMLQPDAKPKNLVELGMTAKQVATVQGLSVRNQGGILLVGPTGSGKTTTIYALLNSIDIRKKSLISVEDPIEYTISNANQQQVNIKAGVTFEALLKSSVRQDPDILFIGEIRDPLSAQIAFDFASTGHLTISSLHTANSTSAINRLERLGMKRNALSEGVICVIAQRLLKKLCPACKRVLSPTQEDLQYLAPFTDELPAEVANPVGCLQCNSTGYFGREAVYEVLEFDAEIIDLVQKGKPISEIREFCRQRGDMLLSGHVLEKVRKLIFSPRDAYEKVLAEEIGITDSVDSEGENQLLELQDSEKRILVVDNDKDSGLLTKSYLEDEGFYVTLTSDGLEALTLATTERFGLIISEVIMPVINGFNLLSEINKHNIGTPLVYLTINDDENNEKKGLDLGAADYIRKPVKKDILLLRVRKILQL